MIDNLFFSISSIFELYRSKAKSFYGFSFAFILLASIVSAVCALIVCWGADKLYILGYDELRFYIWYLKFTQLSIYCLVIFLGLYALCLKKVEDKRIIDKPSLQIFIKSISQNEWNNFVILLSIYLILYMITIKDLFDTSSEKTGFFNFSQNYNSTDDAKYKLYGWLNSMIQLIKEYLPFLFSFLFLARVIIGKLSWKIIMQYKNALLSLFILVFCISAISLSINDYIIKYIIKLIEVPFKDSIGPGIFSSFIYFMLGTYFCLAFAAAIYYPFIYEHKKIISLSEELPV